MNLFQAWLAAVDTLKPQVQGDCGVYSFWYATILLRTINPSDSREVVYPRCHFTTKARAAASGKSRDWPDGDVDKDHSIRHRVKNLVNSGQGEIMSAEEMKKVVKSFGYGCPGVTFEQDREAFITTCLKQNWPVIFAYMKGDDGPISAVPPGKKGGSDYGSHWSLIIHESDSKYSYLDPHHPNKPSIVLKNKLLASNSFVDSYKYVRYWTKADDGGIDQSGNWWPWWTRRKVYDIGQGGRTQKLAGAMVAVC